jgi:hypothetical protein
VDSETKKIVMTTKEIQQVLRKLYREALERFAASEAPGLGKPERTTLTLAKLTLEEQEQIEVYVERLFNEARALCLRFQQQCPMVRDGEADRGVMNQIERFYKAQYHAMERLGRRCDGWQWIHVHIRKARSSTKEANAESSDWRRCDTMTDEPTKDQTDGEQLEQMFGNLPEIRITSEGLEDLERRGGDIRRRLELKQAVLARAEALQRLATAYKEGREAGGKEEAERRMKKKFDEINPPETEAYDEHIDSSNRSD